MDLFKKLDEVMGNGTSLVVSISKSESGITVGVMPGNNLVKDAAKNSIVPLNVSGTASELDDCFVDIICNPVGKANTFYSNVKEFEDSVAKAQSESAMKKKEAEEKKKKAEEQKKANESFMPWFNLAKKNYEADKFEDATQVLNTLEDLATNISDANKKMADELRMKIQEKSSASDMFGTQYEDKSDGEWLSLDKDEEV